MTPPPDAGLVPPFGRAIQPLIHAPEAIDSARVSGIRVIESAVLEHERAQAWPFAKVRALIGAGHPCEDGGSVVRILRIGGGLKRRFAPEVVFDSFLPLLLLGEPDAEVEVEVAAERRCPWEGPSHPLLVGLQLLE